MNIKLNDISNKSITEQIYEQVKHSIIYGEIINGDYLPSIDELSKELKINPSHIIKAYRQLEIDDLIKVNDDKKISVSMDTKFRKK